MEDRPSPDGVTLRRLYPDLDGVQLREAEERLDRYLQFTLRLYDRLRADGASSTSAVDNVTPGAPSWRAFPSNP